MSEETPAKIPVLASLRQKFKTQVQALTDQEDSGSVRGRVVGALVEAEISERAAALTKLLIRREKLYKHLTTIDRPDVTTYNKDKSVASATYTQGRIKECTNIAKLISDIDSAVEKGFDDQNPDYSKIKELAAKPEPNLKAEEPKPAEAEAQS